MRKRRILLILGCLVFACLLSACGTKDKNYMATVEEHPLSEAEIVAFVQDHMLQKFNDEVDVVITNKGDLQHVTHVEPGLDGGASLFGRKYVDVKDGHRYTVRITNKQYGFSVNGTYYDGFSLYNKETKTTEFIDREVTVDTSYENQRFYALMVEEYKSILDEYVSNYRFYGDVTNNEMIIRFFNVYLCDANADAAVDALKKMVEVSYEKCGSVDAIRVFVFTDEKIFNSIDFNAVNNVAFVSDYEENPAPGMLLRSDLEQRPYKLLEKYFGEAMTLIASEDGLEPELAADKVQDHSHVVYLLEGLRGTYSSTKGYKPEMVKYGKTSVYGFAWEKPVQ